MRPAAPGCSPIELGGRTGDYNGLWGWIVSSFRKGVLTGLLLAYAPAMILAVLAVILSQGRPSVPEDAVLVVELAGGVPERIASEMPGFLPGSGGPDAMTLYGLTEAIRAAAEDADVRALVLHGNGSAAGWAKAQELRWAIEEFRESGKPVWAFLAAAGREDYYIASLADRIAMQPLSYLNMSGLRAEVMFFKGSLDKLGVEVDLIRAGRYKTAGEPFSRAELSEEWREVLDATLDEFYGQLVEGIARGRGQDAGHWRSVLDEGPFDADAALRLGLADDILDEREFFEALGEELELEDVNRVMPAAYSRAARAGGGRGPRIAMLHAGGTIVSGPSWTDPFSGLQSTLGSDTFVSQLQDLSADESVAGVILRIDSPGGDAIASEQILTAVRRLAEEKPLVVSMSSVAASGGYYIASVPDVPIVAYPGTYTGSIGVFTMHLNLRELYGKLGITKQVLTRGRFAGLGSDYKPLSGAEREKVRGYVDTIYDAFLDRVAAGRGVDVDSVRDLAEGRVWIGSQAAGNGLVDELGGYERALALVKQSAGLDSGDSVRVFSYPPRRSLMDVLLSQDGPFSWSRLFAPPVLAGTGESWGQLARWAGLLKAGPVLMASPYRLEVD